MRLCYLIPEFPGLTHVIFWREIRRLREAGVEVIVASTRRPPVAGPHDLDSEPCFYAWPPKAVMLRGLPSPWRLMAQLRFALSLPQGGWRERLSVVAMLPASWMLAGHLRRAAIDHLHVQSFAGSAYLAALAHLAGGVPYSLVLHGGTAVYGLNHAAKLRQSLFACGVSTETRRQIEAIAPGKVLAEDIQCGVDLEMFRPVERPITAPLRLISVGRMDHCKGIGLALEAVALLRGRVDLRYTLVGSGPHQAEIRAHAGRLGLDDIVSFLGPRGQSEIVALLHRHDVAVLTSYGAGEATATAVREAMATGMPVIMSRIGEAERMIDDRVDGLLVDQGDVSAIAAAMQWYADNRDRIAAMGQAARRRAHRDFDDRIGPRRLRRAIEERLVPVRDERCDRDAPRSKPPGFRPPPSAAPPPPRPS